MISNPRLIAGLFYAEKAGKHLFFNTEIPNWLVTNSNGAIILSKCDGTLSADEIAISCNATIEDVDKILSIAVSNGVIDDDSDNSSHVFDSFQDSARKRSTLNIVHWKLTNLCNLKCKYCYAESGSGKSFIPYSKLVSVSKEIADISPNVNHTLSGGEPLLNPDCLRFAEYLKASGNSVSLLTNGTLINKHDVKIIAALTDRVKISLDGSSEETHAVTRGYGNYKKICLAIDKLIKANANVQIAMTVHKGNTHDVGPMTARYGNRLLFQPLFKAGRGAKIDELVLTGNEYYEALASVESVSPMASIGAILESLRGRGAKRCALADSEISISENGDVYPCQLLAVPEFFSGNIYESSLRDIYFNSPILLKAREISVDTLEKCKKCPIRLICAGGCRARDYYEIGTTEAVGKFCEYEQQAFLHGLFDSVFLE